MHRLTRLVLLIFLVLPFSHTFALPPDSSRLSAAGLDSLYSYAYFKHRVYGCDQRLSIPRQTRRRLLRSASEADSLLLRYEGKVPAEYSYLLTWIKSPERSEDEVRGRAGLHRSCSLCELRDTAGYTAFQDRVTSLRLAAKAAIRQKDTIRAMDCYDSIVTFVPFPTDELLYAKKMAIARRDTARYQRYFGMNPYRDFAQRFKGDTSWSMTRVPEEKAFVKASIRKLVAPELGARLTDPQSLTLLMNRYELLHDNTSIALFPPRSAIGILLLRHKRRIREVYCDIVAEGFTQTPDLLCQELATRSAISSATTFTLNYLALHLSQLNAYGPVYPQAVFENYLRFLECLAYNRLFDMESYAECYDLYVTAVLKQDPVYGAGVRIKANDFEEYTKNTDATRARRIARHLQPDYE